MPNSSAFQNYFRCFPENHILAYLNNSIYVIRREARKAGLPEPEFRVSRGLFAVILRNGIGLEVVEIDKTDIRKAVLQYCSIPRTREELTGFTGKSRYYTMSSIIQPLIEQGKIRLSIPEKPKSPKQKYIAVI